MSGFLSGVHLETILSPILLSTLYTTEFCERSTEMVTNEQMLGRLTLYTNTVGSHHYSQKRKMRVFSTETNTGVFKTRINWGKQILWTRRLVDYTLFVAGLWRWRYCSSFKETPNGNFLGWGTFIWGPSKVSLNTAASPGVSWVPREKRLRLETKNFILMTSLCPEFRRRFQLATLLHFLYN